MPSSDRIHRARLAHLGLAAGLGGACGDDLAPSTAAATTGGQASSTAVDGAGTTPPVITETGLAGSGSSDGGPPPLPEVWQPGVLLPSDADPHPRGWLDRRGLVHTHSPYSHDACDDKPRDEDGNLDAQCVSDLRRALCQVRHDFVMLTDHRDSFSDSDYPEVLLYDPAQGDALVERDGKPVANWAGCELDAPGVPPTLVLAGCEAALMPVVLPEHAPGRGQTYGDPTPESIASLKETGAVVLVAHTENYTVEELVELPLDGFEMFNLHANLFANIAAGAQLINEIRDEPDKVPHPDLVVMPIWSEDPRYLERWGGALAAGARRVTTAGTDAHRNTFPELLEDGERLDSYRRMMHWFSNHLLVSEADGDDDRAIAAALREGRLYAAFEYLGYPRGFDATASVGGVVTEIGGEVAHQAGLVIEATAPVVRRLDPAATPPEISLHLMRATETGFEEVAAGGSSLSWPVDAPGAYRIEVRMIPHHLEPYLASYAALAAEPRVWIYANPFYVR